MNPFERFTEAAQEVLTNSYQILIEQHHSQLEVEHILMAMLQQKDGFIQQVLERLGKDISLIKLAVQEKLDTTPNPQPPLTLKSKSGMQVTMYMTTRLQRFFETADQERQYSHDKFIDNKHLLLAMVSDIADPIARLLLVGFGMSKEQIRNTKNQGFQNNNLLTEISTRPIRVFLCHSSNDKPAVRALYEQLLKEKGIIPWLDEEDLLPGQKWQREIPKAVRSSDIVIVCLSRNSINKAGYVQKEIKFALDIADEQPEDTIFLIPLKLEECEVPERLSELQWVSYFEEKGYQRLLKALRKRTESLTPDP